jgi:hypothetical protein
MATDRIQQSPMNVTRPIRRVVLVAETLVAATLAIGVAAIILAVVAGAEPLPQRYQYRYPQYRYPQPVTYRVARARDRDPVDRRGMVECEVAPGDGRYVYRIVDERKCWFPAGNLRRGEEKALDELRWPAPPALEISDKPPWPQSGVPELHNPAAATLCPPTGKFEPDPVSAGWRLEDRWPR